MTLPCGFAVVIRPFPLQGKLQTFGGKSKSRFSPTILEILTRQDSTSKGTCAKSWNATAVYLTSLGNGWGYRQRTSQTTTS